MRRTRWTLLGLLIVCAQARAEEEPWWKPYSPPCVERENVFEFTERLSVKTVGPDRYEIAFAVKGYCDVTVSVISPSKEMVAGRGTVVRHLASGVLGVNAPEPFQKDSLRQVLVWDGKDDLGEYVKEPQALRVRVSLGLKPEFDKRLGGTSGNNLPGYVWGIAIDSEGAYVFVHGSHSHGLLFLRKFDHDGNYVQSLLPAPANLPESKLGGLAYVEYEPGKKAVHGATLTETVSRDCSVFIKFVGDAGMAACQPALSKGRLFISQCFSEKVSGKEVPAKLVYVRTDGSTDAKGVWGRPFVTGSFPRPFFTASPDGSTIYMTGAEGIAKSIQPVVLHASADGEETATPFVGDPKAPGTDKTHFQNPKGLDCDGQGRLYVADSGNDRIQVFSPDGTHLKSIPIDRPEFVCVHRKTGAIYVLHGARTRGQTKGRLTKLTSFDQPKEEFYVDDLWAVAMALDSWTTKPRLWLGGHTAIAGLQEAKGIGPSVRIFEEQDGTLKRILDFDEVARQEAGASYFGRFRGVASDQRDYGAHKSIGDPTREKLYYRNRLVFDLPTGKYEGQFSIIDRVGYDDIAFDRKGYMHGHSTLNFMPPPLYQGRVWRVDPAKATLKSEKGTEENGGPICEYPEVPYDYGIEDGTAGGPKPWSSVVRTECQAASHGFQHGFGVNMRGDLVVCSRITYVPRMEDEVKDLVFDGYLTRTQERGYGGGAGEGLYASYTRRIEDMLKKGEVFFIKRRPGIALWGDTIWTYNATGQRRFPTFSAVIGGRLAGVHIDENRHLYFSAARPRLVNGRPFLEGRGGTFGLPDDETNRNPYMGTYIRARPDDVRVLMANAPVPLDAKPDRPKEVGGSYAVDGGWVEGAEWFYAGASPIVQGGCECPSSRPHLDWYRRSYVPESYRHSIGVLDANGNLIMHVGQYGNFDSGLGVNSQIPVGGDQIGMYNVRYIGGTDNYLCFDDLGERLTVLRLSYHAEEMAAIGK